MPVYTSSPSPTRPLPTPPSPASPIQVVFLFLPSYFFKCTHDVFQIKQNYAACCKKIKHMYATSTFQEVKEKWEDGKGVNGVLIHHCPICPIRMNRLQHLLGHVGSKHFKQQLLESYAGQGKNTCKKCDKSFGSHNHLVNLNNITVQ